MAIYAYGDPDPDNKNGNRKFVYDSLVNDKISRFLYSWYPNCDLRRLAKLSRENMTGDEQYSWSKAQRLLNFRPGDWVIHKNVPEWGQCTAARLSSEYFYQDQLPANRGDGRYCFHVDKVIRFTRGDNRLHPIIYSRLKVMGALYQIYFEKEFYESLIALGYELDDIDKKKLAGLEIDADKVKGGDHFKRELNAVFDGLTAVIQRHHPGKDLEGFLAEVFRKMPGVIEVKENGSGWGPDFGADLIVKSQKHKIVVQVKSYVGEVWDTNCVDQLKTAIEEFDATLGIIITTGQRTPLLDEAVKKLADAMRKKNVEVRLIAGGDVAKFVLKYNPQLLLK